MEVRDPGAVVDRTEMRFALRRDASSQVKSFFANLPMQIRSNRKVLVLISHTQLISVSADREHGRDGGSLLELLRLCMWRFRQEDNHSRRQDPNDDVWNAER